MGKSVWLLRSVWVSVTFLTFLFFEFSLQAQPDGQKLFNQNCARCHKVHQDFTGPALAGVTEEHEEEWLLSWINNSPAMIAKGDDYAVEIYEEWDKQDMPAFPQLDEADIRAVLAYIEAETERGPGATVADAGEPGAAAETDDAGIKTILIVISVILLLIALALARIQGSLNRLVKEKAGEPVPEPLTIRKIIRNRKVAAAAVIVVVVFLCAKLYDGAASLGRQQGYQPTQPIAFSHKIHAGINQIECKYCHFNAEKSRTAGIPSVDVCMNCHDAIQDYPEEVFSGNTGTEEIAKLLAAHENNAPIEWIKVHNLPDHVFFSHAQHVKVADIECQECHGPVEEMDELHQHAPLSMGWCVNCHRDTEVNIMDNEYYSIYEQLHKDLKAGKIDRVTAADMGGTECQRCHY